MKHSTSDVLRASSKEMFGVNTFGAVQRQAMPFSSHPLSGSSATVVAVPPCGTIEHDSTRARTTRTRTHACI